MSICGLECCIDATENDPSKGINDNGKFAPSDFKYCIFIEFNCNYNLISF